MSDKWWMFIFFIEGLALGVIFGFAFGLKRAEENSPPQADYNPDCMGLGPDNLPNCQCRQVYYHSLSH
jgi:hypothetical protein